MSVYNTHIWGNTKFHLYRDLFLTTLENLEIHIDEIQLILVICLQKLNIDEYLYTADFVA